MKYHVDMSNEIKRKYTIKEILATHWNDFVREMKRLNKPIRQTIIDEVEKVIGCQYPRNGFSLYVCTKCKEILHVPFTCKSRFCNCCGAKYSKDRAMNISRKLLKCSHRHVVLTIPEELRKYFAHDRKLLNLLFQAAVNTITFCFNKRSKSENYIPGMVCVLHTFGRDLKWNPHIHMILCEEAVGKSNVWKRFSHINYEGLRRSWQYSVLKLLSEKITDPVFKALVSKLYADHKEGFYIYCPPIKNFSSGVIKYIARYAGRPVLAQSRIIGYDGKTVTFTYTPHDSDEPVTETVSVFDFIKKLIIHIPDRNFKMIRYFGFYFNKNPKYKQYLLRARKVDPSLCSLYKTGNSSWRKRIFSSFLRDPLKCICGAYMELIEKFNTPRKISSYFYNYNPGLSPP